MNHSPPEQLGSCSCNGIVAAKPSGEMLEAYCGLVTSNDGLSGSEARPLGAVLSAAEIARMTGLTAGSVNAKLSAGGITPVGRANRVLQYRQMDVASVVDRMRVPTPYRIAIAHRKGGQAKTTTTFYLGRELAARVLAASLQGHDRLAIGVIS